MTPLRFFRSPAGIWAILVIATLLSCASWLGGDEGGQRLAGAAVMAIAFFKARLIGLHFMELRGAIWPLRLLFELWAIVICLLLVTMLW